jgi:copper chaperone CopZ
MRFTLLLLLLVATGGFSKTHAAPPGPVTRTFYVTGVECGACVYLVQLSASERKGVLKAEVEQTADSYANVTFDPGIVSEHQIAQAIREAMPLHGAPYLARLKMRVGQYAVHAAAVALVFERWRDLVRWEVLDEAKGELLVHFLPLETGPAQTGAVGWSTVELLRALQGGLPDGVTVKFVEEKP